MTRSAVERDLRISKDKLARGIYLWDKGELSKKEQEAHSDLYPRIDVLERILRKFDEIDKLSEKL